MQHLQWKFLMLFLFFMIENTRAFSQIGYEIKDLQETEFALFQKEAEHWKIFFDGKRLDSLIFNGTEGKFILGDPNVLKICNSEETFIYFARIYTGLPPHKSVMFVGKFWYFDGGPGLSKPDLEVDLSYSPGIPLQWVELQPETRSQTENPLYEVNFGYLNAREIHFDSTLHLTIKFSAIATPEKPVSFGIREIILHFSIDDLKNIDERHECFLSQNALNFYHPQCSCPFGQALNGNSCCNAWVYDYGNGTCLETCEWPFKKVETKDGKKLCVQYCKSNEYFWGYGSELIRCRASCPTPLVPLTDNNGLLICQNPCVDGRDFLYPNESCIATCPVPLVAVFEYEARFCKNPCESKSDFLYANRSCLGGCPAPLQIRSEPIANFCVNPCHSKNLYLYQNGSCLPSCPSPGRIGGEYGVKYCLPPCQMTREYILGNGSCSLECPAPLTRRTVASVGTLCLNPCETADDFLYGNGSCLSNCPDYFQIKREYGVKYCLSPCLVDQYYFENNKSCLSICPYPFKIISEGGINLCKNQCSGAKPFLYDDESCHEGCPMPLVIQAGNSCKSPCLKKNEYVNKDGGCQEICESPEKMVKIGPYQICLPDEKRYQNNGAREIIKISNLLSEIGGILSGDPTSLLMLPLLNMFEQISMINMKLPVNIQGILIGEKNLEKYKVSAHLSENIDKKLRAIWIIFLIYFLLTGIKIFIKSDRRSQISRLLNSIWSIFVLLIIGESGNAVLYLILTTDNLQWNRLLIFITVILFTTFVGYKIICLRRNLSQEQPERWRFLFETYQSNGFFMLIYILKMVLLSFIIGYLSQYPQLQATLIVLMNLGMLLYLVLGSPIAKRINYLQHLIIETALFLYNGIFVILAVFDLKDEDEKNISGRLMTTLYFTGSLITALIILLKLLKNTYHLLFKAQESQASHIQLRELRESSEEDEEERNENFEQRQTSVNGVGFREINQEDFDAEDNEIEADVVIE